MVNIAKCEALKNGDSEVAYDELPASVLMHKQVQQLACAEWPEQLSHWCKTAESKFMDAHALFICSDHRGVGAVAEKELLLLGEAPAVGRAAAAQPMCSCGRSRRSWGSPRRPSSPLDAAKGGASSFVTLDHLLLVDKLLQNAKPKALCSGPAYSAKSFGERVDVAVSVLIGRRGMLAADSQLGGYSGSAGGDSSGSATASVTGSKTTGGYDAARLQHVKFSSDFVNARAQFLMLWDSGRVDEAILVLLRGSSSVDASGATVRSPPLKVFHDLLFGTKDVYVIDQDMERQIKSARDQGTTFQPSLGGVWPSRSARR